MAQEIDVKDLKRHRQKKKRRQFFQKLGALTFIVALGLILFFTRGKWIPLFDGIGSKLINSGSGDGDFPLEVVSGSGYQVSVLDNGFAVLTDSYLKYYTPDGGLVKEEQHAYTSPVMESNSKKTLVYDAGGKKFRLDSRNKNFFEKESEEPIIFARLGANDYTAVVTKSDKHLAVLTVYNETGKYIYKVNYSEIVTDVMFTQSGDGIAAVLVDTEGGQLFSGLHNFSFNMKQEIWSSPLIDALAFNGKTRPDGSFAVFGDTRCAYYNSNGTLIGSYVYSDALTGYDCTGGLTVLSFRNEERRKSYVTVIREPIGSPLRLTFQGEIIQAASDGNTVFILTENSIKQYSESGTLLSDVPVDEGMTGFRIMENQLILIGYDEIQRIALS